MTIPDPFRTGAVTNAASLPPNPPTRPAVCYVRTFLEDRAAVEYQRDACRRLAAERGITITVEILDTGVSSARADRKGLTALFDAIDRYHLGYVISSDAKRLARNHELFESLRARLAAHGAVLLLSDMSARPGRGTA